MNDHDLPPLADPASGAPPVLREALAAARADEPSRAQLAALAARLPLGTPPPASPSPSLPPGAGAAGATAAPPSVLSGALVGAALGVLVSSAGYVWDARHDRSAAEPPATRTPIVAVAPTAAEPPKLPELPPLFPEPRTERPSSAEARTAPAHPASEPSAALTAASARAEAPPDPGTAAPGTEASRGGRTEPAFPSDTLRTEVEILQNARDALRRGNATGALALTQEHATRFPAGKLSLEREVLAIEALYQLGRKDEARPRAQRVIATFPNSPFRPRLEALFGP